MRQNEQRNPFPAAMRYLAGADFLTPQHQWFLPLFAAAATWWPPFSMNLRFRGHQANPGAGS
jgi:hypothetical protein